MTEAATTPASAGSDSVRPSLSIEDAAEIEIYDPADEQETVDAGHPQHSENETDEATDGQETDEVEASADGDDVAEGEGQGEENSTPEPADTATITIDGRTLTIGELKKGYHREADYTRHKQVVATKEQRLEAMSARVTNTVTAVADFLVKQIPAAPDPSLAMTDPGRFVQMKAVHEAAVAQVNALLSQAGEVNAVSGELTAQQRAELLQEENAKLAEAFPSTATDEGRKKFFDDATSAAIELGYAPDEIAGVSDHRMFRLAHYAMLGLRAEQAKAKAREKVASVPPVAPQKRQQGASASLAAKNREAMKRLARSGSIADAMAIDFD